MFDQRKVGVAVVASAFSLAIGVPAHAASFTNGDFGTGDLTGWNTAGFTYVDGTDSVGQSYPHPANTPNEAQVATFDNETYYNNSYQDISPSSLETQLGLTSGSLESKNPNFASGSGVVSGSGISQTVNLQAGDTISFNYDFLTNETPGSTKYDDFAFFQANSADYTSPLETIASVANSSFNQTTTAPDFLYDTGFKTYSFTVPTSGAYTISVGATNVGTGSTGGDSDTFPSAILATNFTATGASSDPSAVTAAAFDPPAAVPEPSFTPGILSLLAVGSILHYQRRRKQQQQ
jgi:hypothetical protein